MKNIFKKAAVSVAALSPVALFAEGEAGTIDLAAATTALTSMTNAVKGWVTSAAPVLVGLLGAGLVITLIFVVLKMTKKGTNKATS